MSHHIVQTQSHALRKIFAVTIGGFFLVLVLIMTALMVRMAFFTIPTVQEKLDRVEDLAEQTLYRISAQAQRSR